MRTQFKRLPKVLQPLPALDIKALPSEVERQTLPEYQPEIPFMSKLMLSRRTFCARAGTALCMAGMEPLLRATAAEGQRPNVVYILADDLGWGDMDVYNTHSA